jgi:hypothetical protein
MLALRLRREVGQAAQLKGCTKRLTWEFPKHRISVDIDSLWTPRVDVLYSFEFCLPFPVLPSRLRFFIMFLPLNHAFTSSIFHSRRGFYFFQGMIVQKSGGPLQLPFENPLLL